MNTKRLTIASVAVFITMFALEFIIHGMLLQPLYQQLASLWRPEADMHRLMWMMWLGYAIFAPFYVLIYSKGIEKGKSGLEQGIRFGILVGLALAPMTALSWYVILAIPCKLGVYWGIAAFAEYVVCGAVAGLTYKNS